MSFKPRDRSASDFSKLTANCFPLDLLGVDPDLTIFEVTSGYSLSENDFFLRERHLLDKSEAGTADNRLKTNDLLI